VKETPEELRGLLRDWDRDMSVEGFKRRFGLENVK
jgi:hypothetical protein